MSDVVRKATAACDVDADKARCGEDQVPVPDATPDEDGAYHQPPHETRPGGVGYTGALRRIDAASGDPEPLVAARALAVEAIGISAVQVGPGAYTACRLATPANANVWQQCMAMAHVLEHRSDSLQARMTGASIDQKLTGNAKPSRQAAAEMKGMLALDLASSSSCGDLRAKLADMRRMAVGGEASLLSR